MMYLKVFVGIMLLSMLFTFVAFGDYMKSPTERLCWLMLYAALILAVAFLPRRRKA
jgi:hypothetical protein